MHSFRSILGQRMNPATHACEHRKHALGFSGNFCGKVVNKSDLVDYPVAEQQGSTFSVSVEVQRHQGVHSNGYVVVHDEFLQQR